MRQTIALLMLVPLLLLPTGTTSGPTDVLVSPDGVALHDYSQGSTVWGRMFSFNPPEGVLETEIFSLCEFEGLDAAVARWACLEPYIDDVQWSIPGTPGSWQESLASIEGLPKPPSFGISTVTDAAATFEVTDFVIHDDIDCTPFCNKDAEGYVYFYAWTSSGWSQSSALFCETQSDNEGACNVDRYNSNFLVTNVGPNSCPGILGQVEFRDDDGASDDLMDISSRSSDGVADIQGVLPAGGAPCNAEDDQWWSERGNTDSVAGDRCHAISVATFCDLYGQGDGAGDNDDAELDFTLY